MTGKKLKFPYGNNDFYQQSMVKSYDYALFSVLPSALRDWCGKR